MEDAARYADRVAIMHEGQCVLSGDPIDIFGNEERLAEYRLAAPRVVRFQRKVEASTRLSISQTLLNRGTVGY